MNAKPMLSAEKGADRVAERYYQLKKAGPTVNQDEDMSNDEDYESTPKYTCENCGVHEFIVYYTFEDNQTVLENLPCACGKSDIAAILEFILTRKHEWKGQLNAEHRVHYDEKDYELEREADRPDITCQNCFENADSSDWEPEDNDEWEKNEDSEFFEVRCAECDHEIEFGWSHLEGGRIWPCESSDFNPKKCFPESRFYDAWKRRDWIRAKKPRSKG